MKIDSTTFQTLQLFKTLQLQKSNYLLLKLRCTRIEDLDGICLLYIKKLPRAKTILSSTVYIITHLTRPITFAIRFYLIVKYEVLSQLQLQLRWAKTLRFFRLYSFLDSTVFKTLQLYLCAFFKRNRIIFYLSLGAQEQRTSTKSVYFTLSYSQEPRLF